MSIDTFVAPPCKSVVEILYQDDDILLIDKPSGLLSLSGKNPLNWDSVHHRLTHGQEGVSQAFPEAKMPHRLDFGTSGIMLISLNSESTTHLNKQFQTRQVQKKYKAVLKGWVQDDEGLISAPIAKGEARFAKVRVCAATGKEAVTEYKVLKRLEDPRCSVVEFRPVTGRTHQLRVHSLELGHPILGCDLYNSDDSENMAPRLLLHASDLYFEHPSSGLAMHGHSNFRILTK